MLEDPDIKNYILNYAKKQYVERQDNPLDILPHSVVASKYYTTEFEKYKNELERLKKLTIEEAKSEEVTHREKEIHDYKEYLEINNKKMDVLKHRRLKIQQWDCPASLTELKNDMIDNISDDINLMVDRSKYESLLYEMSGSEFKEEMVERYQRIVDDLSYDVKREQKWANETNKMLNDLKDNLGDW
jgi:hypothetical protein